MSEPKSQECGVSLVELVIGASIAAIGAVALISIVRITHSSASTVCRETESNRVLRHAAQLLCRDIRQATATRLSVESLPDGNHRVTLQQPIGTTGGVVDWGVYEPALGQDEPSRTRSGWFVRYTVETETTTGSSQRRLVRQVLDNNFGIRHQMVLVRDLGIGSATPAGFRLRPNGALWNVTLTANATPGQPRARGINLDLALMN